MFLGKNILITQRMLKHFAGSEIVTLELATFFKQHGANVIVFTWAYDNPIKSIFEERGIPVTTNDYDERIKDIDYVWVHHQVLPIKLIDQLYKEQPQPIFIFYHMSALIDIYAEHPFIYDLEKKLSSKSLFVSKEALELATTSYPDLLDFKRTSILPNMSPDTFCTNPATIHKQPQKILIVSNHAPEEVLSIKDRLEKTGIKVDQLNSFLKNPSLVSPEILNEYDVVISIGKTVQYCLTSGKPIYIYDKFGGCGYLNESNFELAAKNNFSGRGFDKKTAGIIASEILKNYSSAIKYQNDNQSNFIDMFSMEKSIKKVFQNLKPKELSSFSNGFLFCVKACESMAQSNILAENHLTEIAKLRNSLTIASNTIAELNIKNTPSKTRRILSFGKQALLHPQKTLSRKINNYRPKIVLAMCVRNEELNIDGCLSHAEKYVDDIVIFDDHSTDNTIKHAKKHPKVTKIITNNTRHSWQERENRKILLTTIRDIFEKRPVWVLCIDADERFETSFLKNLRNLAKKHRQGNVAITVHFRELWDDIDHFRIDKIWGQKRKGIFFKLTDKMTFQYENEHHIPWYYQELSGKELLLDYNLYHLKMIKPKDREARAKLYNKLDPNKKMQSIGYDYLTDTTGLKKSTIPIGKEYDKSSVPAYYK